MLADELIDEVLGTLRRDGFAYAGHILFGDQEIPITLSPADPYDNRRRDFSKPLKRARSVAASVHEYVILATGFAVSELLPLLNSEWLEEGGEPLAEEQLRESLTLASISFDEEGRAIFWFDETKEHFLGHFVEVRLDADDRFISAEVLG